MKKFIIILLCAGSLMAQESKIKSSDVRWTGYGAVGGYSLSGSLPVQQATFERDTLGDLETGRVVFNMKGMAHENESLLRHLKSEDFFYVRKFPTATFQIREIRDTLLIGALTMKGVTRKVEVPCRIVRTQYGTRLGGEVRIDCTEFGVNYNSDKFFQNLGSNAIKDEFLVEFELVVE